MNAIRVGIKMDLKDAIRSSYLAHGLSEAQLESLYALAEWRSFKSGKEILRQFDESRDLMILASGLAHILTVVGEPIGLIKPGMPMGEISFLDSKPRSGTVVAIEPCEIVVLRPNRSCNCYFRRRKWRQGAFGTSVGCSVHD